MATAAVALALPAILGGLAVLLPGWIYPDGRVPFTTTLERAFVYASTWIGLLAFISPPATLLAAVLAIALGRRAGWRRPVARAVCVIVLVAVALTVMTVWYIWLAMEAHPEFRVRS